MASWKTPQLKSLAKILRRINTQKDMLHFLRDLMTLDELEEIAARWEIVTMLSNGKSYREIAKLTGVSTATVTRIAHWLNHGEGGYKAALKKQ